MDDVLVRERRERDRQRESQQREVYRGEKDFVKATRPKLKARKDVSTSQETSS